MRPLFTLLMYEAVSLWGLEIRLYEARRHGNVTFFFFTGTCQFVDNGMHAMALAIDSKVSDLKHVGIWCLKSAFICMHACMHTSTHTYIHTYIHTYMHTWIYTARHKSPVCEITTHFTTHYTTYLAHFAAHFTTHFATHFATHFTTHFTTHLLSVLLTLLLTLLFSLLYPCPWMLWLWLTVVDSL